MCVLEGESDGRKLRGLVVVVDVVAAMGEIAIIAVTDAVSWIHGPRKKSVCALPNSSLHCLRHAPGRRSAALP